MAKTKFFKCKVLMSHIRMEEFDDKGVPIVVEKFDLHRNKYMETVEKTYKRGDIIVLPENIVKKLGNSVELVMAPVEMTPVEADPSEVEEEPPEGELKESAQGDTVAEKIPKPDKKGSKAK